MVIIIKLFSNSHCNNHDDVDCNHNGNSGNTGIVILALVMMTVIMIITIITFSPKLKPAHVPKIMLDDM